MQCVHVRVCVLVNNVSTGESSVGDGRGAL